MKRKNIIFLKVLPILLLILTTWGNTSKAQGVDAVFLLDNSNSVDNTEWANMSNSTKKLIDQVLGCNTANRVAVVNYSANGTLPSTTDNLERAALYIESNFTSSAATAKSFLRRGGSAPDPSGTGTPGTNGAIMGGGTGTYYAAGLLNNALSGTTSSYVVSAQKTLTQNTTNKLVIFLFTDGRWDNTVGLVGNPLTFTFANYNTLKTSKNATFVVLSIPENASSPNPDNVSAAAAVASVGGSYNGDVWANSGDPQGSGVKPRKMAYSTTFDISTLDISTIVDGICKSCAPIVAISAVTPPTQTICLNGVAQPLIATATGTGTLTYQWYSNTVNSTTGGTLIPGATSATYNPPTSTSGTKYYYVVVTDSYCEGITTSPIVSVAVSNIAAGPVPSFNNTSAYSNSSSFYQIPCGSTTANLSSLAVSNPQAGTVITWHSSSVATSANIINPANALPGTNKYYAAFYRASGGCYSPTRMITVTAPICAVDDDFTSNPIIAGTGGIAGNIYSNDTYNGTIISTMPANSVDWFPELWANTAVTVDGNGNLVVPASMPPGDYTLYLYKICDKDPDVSASSNCSSAEVKFKVIAAFGCTSTMYLSQDDKLYTIGTSTNPFTYPTVGATASVNYNAIAINPLNGLMYGVQASSRNLLRINVDGTVTNLGAITGLPVAGAVFSGEIDDLGNYYVKINTNNNQLYKINLTTRAATLITLSSSNTIPDLGYSVATGLLYGVNSVGGQLVSINPSTGTVTGIGITPGGTISFGAIYTSSTGEVFGVNNAGGFYQFNLITGERVLISGAPASNGNDGAHCVTVPITFSADLSVTKVDGVAQYTPGANTTYFVTVKNNGPFGVLNAQVTDFVPAGIPAANVSYTAIASTGSTTTVSGTQTGAINDLVGLPVGGTVTYTVVVNVPFGYTGNLVNTATVTPPSNITDSNMANNTATDTNTSTACSNNIFNWVQTRKDDPNRNGFSFVYGSNPYVQSLDDAGGTTILTGNFSPAFSTYSVNTNKLEFDLSFTDYNDGVTSELWINGTKYMNLVVPRDNDPTPYYVADYTNRTVTAPVTAFNGATVNGASVVNISESKLDAPASTGVIVKNHITLTFPSNITISSGSIQIRNIYPYLQGTSNWRSQGDYEYWISLAGCLPTTADLYTTKTDGTNNYTPGTSNTYTIVVGNNGPSGVTGAQVSDPLPSGIPAANVSYTAVASAGSTTTVSGTQTGIINDIVTLPVGGTVTYTVTVNIPSNFTGNLVNTVTVTPPSNTVDSNTANNSATDTDILASCFKPGIITGTVLDTTHGITALNRAGDTASGNNWPMVRKGAWTALEAKTKGFVINRLSTAQIANIPAANLIEGMMVYNTDLNCLQVNTTGTVAGWSCLSNQACPSN